MESSGMGAGFGLWILGDFELADGDQDAFMATIGGATLDIHNYK